MKRPENLAVYSLFIFLTAITICKAGFAQEIIINAEDYGLSPNGDATPAIRKALAACRSKKAVKLIISKGAYHLYPDKAEEKYIHISNNDDGLKRLGFPIHGFSNFEIDGQGSLFIVHGEMVPFDFLSSQNIRLKNLSVDWNKPFFFQGTVVRVDSLTRSFELKPYPECDYEIIANELIFLEKPGKAVRPWKDWAFSMQQDVGWQQNIDWNIWFDPSTMAPAYKGNEYVLKSWNETLGVRYHVEQTTEGNLRFFDAAQKLPKVGWVLIVKGKKDLNRTSPAIHLSDVTGFMAENVNVYHAGGMGFIAEKSKDIALKKFNVVLPEGSGRMVTTTADATHFVSCRGMIEIDSCRFENMLDDATNVHGIYTRVDGLVEEHTIGVKRMHGQQQGFQFAGAGDTISLADAGTLKPYAKLEVTEVKEINSGYMELTCKENVGDILMANSVANNLSWQPELVLKNSVVRRNRARSILISTAGDVLVEGNRFESCTFTSILFEGDATFWYESGPVRNVSIRNNYFKNFGLHGGNAPVVQISSGTEPVKNYYYHRNIFFENNTCEVFSRLLVNARSVDNFRFVGNVIKASKDYPLDKHGDKVFSFDHCRDILIKDNVAEKGWPGLGIKGMEPMLRYYKQ